MAKKLVTGDRIVFHNSKSNKELIARGDLLDITLGRIYTITDDWADPCFIDDTGDLNASAGEDGTGKWTKIKN